MSGPRRYRILHLITRLELGGAQQNTLFSVRHHDRDRFEVSLLAGRGGRLDADAEAIPATTVRLVPWLKHSISPASDLLAILRLRAYFKRARIDLVHTHSSKAGILGRIAAGLAGLPAVVHTVHGWSFNPEQSRARRTAYTALERLVAPQTDRLLVVAARHIETGLEQGIGRREQYRVLRSGIDPELYRRPRRSPAELRAELGFTPEQIVVGTISNLKPQKAPLDFVETAVQAHRINPALRFFIAGDGEQMPQVVAAIERAGMQEQIRLLGWREDIPDLLHAMDLFLLTSRFEGLPRVVLQAIAAGRPVVATAVDGTPEVIEDGETGLLAAAGDTARLAEQLTLLAADRELGRRLAEAASRRLDQRFDIREMVHQLDDLYHELLESSGR